MKGKRDDIINQLRCTDPKLSYSLLQRVKEKARVLRDKLGKRPVLMEVCGTHTVAFSNTGIRKALEESIDLRSGPGCPVCVTDQLDIDTMIALGRLENVVLGTFGDMIRVPGSHSTLELEKAHGTRVEFFYSPSDALQWAQGNPARQLIFLGVGFETTAPMVALSIRQAKLMAIKNYSVFSAHKTIVPALKVLVRDRELKIDGFILPGHVSAVIGRQAYDFLSDRHQIPAAVAGFEPLDLLEALDSLTEQLLTGNCRVENKYTRLVKEAGNKVAQKVIQEHYDPADVRWRGFGIIPASGLALKKELLEFDAKKRFTVTVPAPLVPAGCRCGEVLTGKITPPECAMFGNACSPNRPVGPCMVSSEGACGAYYLHSTE